MVRPAYRFLNRYMAWIHRKNMNIPLARQHSCKDDFEQIFVPRKSPVLPQMLVGISIGIKYSPIKKFTAITGAEVHIMSINSSLDNFPSFLTTSDNN